MGAGIEWRREMASFTGMAAVQLASVGINTVYKAAHSKGLTYFVFISYSYIVGTLSLSPLPFILPRREELPPFKLSTFYTIVVSAIFGIMINICLFKGVEYSSPTLASATSALSPAFTIIFGVIFRLEKLDLKSSTTKIKIIGIMLSISGALVAVFYKGPIVLSPSSSSLPPSSTSLHVYDIKWIIGGLLLMLANLFGPAWLIIQGKVMKMYPDEKVVSLIYFICKIAIALPICIVAEESWSAWKLRLDFSLLTIVLAGLFGPSFTALMSTWVVHKKGPLYVAIFTPVSVVIAVISGVIFLSETLFLGSVVGATILLLGFYAVIWTKAQEDKVTKDCASGSSNEKTSLLRRNSASIRDWKLTHVLSS